MCPEVRAEGLGRGWQSSEGKHLLGLGLWWADPWEPGGGGWMGFGTAPGRLVAIPTASSSSSIHLQLSRQRGCEGKSWRMHGVPHPPSPAWCPSRSPAPAALGQVTSPLSFCICSLSR